MYKSQNCLVSVRMPSDLVIKLDSVASHFGYYKRSDVLRAFVSQVFHDLSDSEVYDIMRNLARRAETRKVLRLHDPIS